MKRNLILLGVFVILAAFLFGTSCTCYGENGEEIRGCGYQCAECNADNKGCRMACLDQLCPGEDIYEDYVDSISLVGEVGTDYTTPTVRYDFESDPYNVQLSTDVLKIYEGPWALEAEICFLQNGTLVGRTEITETVRTSGSFTTSRSVSWNEFYDVEGGAVIAVLNHVSLTREG